MTVNTNGIIESIDILKNEFPDVIVIVDFKAVESLALDERMESFNTRIIVRIKSFMFSSSFSGKTFTQPL